MAEGWPSPRRAVGVLSFSMALIFIAWLPLGVFDIVPFALSLYGESALRTHGAAAVGCLMVAAWGFWK